MTTDIRLAQALNPRMQAALDLGQPIVSIEGLSLWYGEKRALKNISMSVPAQRITAYIGPSGCGKSTLLRCFNRMNDLVDGVRLEGKIRIGGIDVYDPALDVTELRKRVGMVFQSLTRFPSRSTRTPPTAHASSACAIATSSTPLSSAACVGRPSGMKCRTG